MSRELEMQIDLPLNTLNKILENGGGSNYEDAVRKAVFYYCEATSRDKAKREQSECPIKLENEG